MAIAKLELNDLISYKGEVEQYIDVLQETQNKIDSLERTNSDIQKEIGEYEDASRKCDQIISELSDKLRQLEDKERRLEDEIRRLKAEIQMVKAQIAALKSEVAALAAELAAAPPKAKPAIAAELSAKKAELSEAEAHKADLEKKLDQAERELDRTKRNIETANKLINQSEQKQSQIREGIQSLNSASSDLQKTIGELNDMLQKMVSDSRRSTDCLADSIKYIDNYLAITLENTIYERAKNVTLRGGCINREYAGRTYDYKNEEEKIDAARLASEKGVYDDLLRRYDIKTDESGKPVADTDKFTFKKYSFADKNEENMKNGICLRGSNYRKDSADVDLVIRQLKEEGYSMEQINEILSKNKLYYDSDKKTVRLIPSDLQKTLCDNKLKGRTSSGQVAEFTVADYLDGGGKRKEDLELLRVKYPDIEYSPIDSYGNTYPQFAKYEIISFTYPPVSLESYRSGSCLVGDSASGSPDFKKFRESMIATGRYTSADVDKLLETNTIHHDEDGRTLRLIPRDLHEACRHNGGAEKIRLQISMLNI